MGSPLMGRCGHGQQPRSSHWPALVTGAARAVFVLAGQGRGAGAKPPVSSQAKAEAIVAPSVVYVTTKWRGGGRPPHRPPLLPPSLLPYHPLPRFVPRAPRHRRWAAGPNPFGGVAKTETGAASGETGAKPEPASGPKVSEKKKPARENFHMGKYFSRPPPGAPPPFSPAGHGFHCDQRGSAPAARAPPAITVGAEKK